jgi:hypothetical protein
LTSSAWQELTDVDILHESEEGANSLIDALLNQQICALLVQNLERLDEAVKEEAEGVHNTLGKYCGFSQVIQNSALKVFPYFNVQFADWFLAWHTLPFWGLRQYVPHKHL